MTRPPPRFALGTAGPFPMAASAAARDLIFRIRNPHRPVSA